MSVLKTSMINKMEGFRTGLVICDISGYKNASEYQTAPLLTAVYEGYSVAALSALRKDSFPTALSFCCSVYHSETTLIHYEGDRIKNGKRQNIFDCQCPFLFTSCSLFFFFFPQF